MIGLVSRTVPSSMKPKHLTAKLRMLCPTAFQGADTAANRKGIPSKRRAARIVTANTESFFGTRFMTRAKKNPRLLISR